MKKTVLRIVSMILLINIVTFTSCQKDETADGNTFLATMEDCTSSDNKTVLNGTHLYWSSGDKIVVFGSHPGKYGIFETRANHSADWTEFQKKEEVGTGPFDGPYRAFYPQGIAGYDGTYIILPAVQHSEDGQLDHCFPMYAYNRNSNVLHFKNICGVFRLSLIKYGVNVKAIKIEAGTKINGEYELSYDEHNLCPVITHTVGGSNAMWFVCDEAQSIASAKDFYIFMPSGEYRNLKIVIYTDDGRYCEKTLKSNVVINCYRSQTTDIIFNGNDLTFVEATPTGALQGRFSVSSTKQVRFSPGNLIYQEGTDSWQFDETQVNRYSTWYNYGSGYYPGNGRYNGYFGEVGYNGEVPPFVDWGMNAIANGGNEPNAWRTLSKDEWNYLFYTRADASDKYGIAEINGDCGLVLLPDNWTLPEGLQFTPGWPETGQFSVVGSQSWRLFHPQRYTMSQWSEMEANGAVYLPEGSYWSSTADDSYVYELYFSFITTGGYDGYITQSSVFYVPHNYYYGFDEYANFPSAQVRLVHDVD